MHVPIVYILYIYIIPTYLFLFLKGTKYESQIKTQNKEHYSRIIHKTHDAIWIAYVWYSVCRNYETIYIHMCENVGSTTIRRMPLPKINFPKFQQPENSKYRKSLCPESRTKSRIIVQNGLFTRIPFPRISFSPFIEINYLK